jgi:hypothetical protein
MAAHTLSPDRDLDQEELKELEALVDIAGIEAVLQGLSEICSLRVGHLAVSDRLLLAALAASDFRWQLDRALNFPLLISCLAAADTATSPLRTLFASSGSPWFRTFLASVTIFTATPDNLATFSWVISVGNFTDRSPPSVVVTNLAAIIARCEAVRCRRLTFMLMT